MANWKDHIGSWAEGAEEQWDRLLQSGDEIRQFIADNDDRLKKKEA